jgi:hypothetical protein
LSNGIAPLSLAALFVEAYSIMAGRGVGGGAPGAKHFRNGLPVADVNWEKWAGEPQPGDEREAYTREELLKMDAAFSARLEKCFCDGSESRASARRCYGQG